MNSEFTERHSLTFAWKTSAILHCLSDLASQRWLICQEDARLSECVKERGMIVTFWELLVNIPNQTVRGSVVFCPDRREWKLGNFFVE